MTDHSQTLAARHIQAATGVPYTHALEAVREGKPPRGWADDVSTNQVARARLARTTEAVLSSSAFTEDVSPLALVAAAAAAAIECRPRRICGFEGRATDPATGDEIDTICPNVPGHPGECFPDGVNYSMWTENPDELRPTILALRAAIEELWEATGSTGTVWSALEKIVPIVVNPVAAEDAEYWWVNQTDLTPFSPPSTGDTATDQ